MRAAVLFLLACSVLASSAHGRRLLQPPQPALPPGASGQPLAAHLPVLPFSRGSSLQIGSSHGLPKFVANAPSSRLMIANAPGSVEPQLSFDVKNHGPSGEPVSFALGRKAGVQDPQVLLQKGVKSFTTGKDGLGLSAFSGGLDLGHEGVSQSTQFQSIDVNQDGATLRGPFSSVHIPLDVLESHGQSAAAPFEPPRDPAAAPRPQPQEPPQRPNSFAAAMPGGGGPGGPGQPTSFAAQRPGDVTGMEGPQRPAQPPRPGTPMGPAPALPPGVSVAPFPTRAQAIAGVKNYIEHASSALAMTGRLPSGVAELANAIASKIGD